MTGRFLGLDIGDRHIGVALSEPETGIVFPRPALRVSDEHDALMQLAQLISENEPEAVIVGHPIGLANNIGPQAAAVEALVEKLRPRVKCEVHLVDERLTSAEARRLATLPADEHSHAAMLILESFLSRRSAI